MGKKLKRREEKRKNKVRMERKEVVRYLLIGMMAMTLVSILIVLRGGLTGYAVFEDSGVDFDSGVYTNVIYNGSAIVLSEENLSGGYVSQVFDAGNDAVWNNLSWVGSEPSVEFLYAVDGGGDVYKSSDLGVNWVLSQENYGRTTATIDMFSNLDYIYILSTGGNEVWRSNDEAGFSLVYSGFNEKSPYVGDADSNENLYVITGPGEVWKSVDNGVSWTLQGDFNGASTNDPKGMTIDSNDYIYVVGGAGNVFSSEAINFTEINNAYFSQDIYGTTYTSGGLFVITKDKVVHKSIDNGINWEVVNSIAIFGEPRGMTSDDSENLYVVTKEEEIYKSTDLGVNWELLVTPFTDKDCANQYALGYDGTYLYAFDNDRDVWRSSNGVSWTEINNAYFSQDIYGITKTSEGLFVVTKDKKIHKSINNGVDWIEIYDGSNMAEEPRGLTSINNVLYLVARTQKIYKSRDNGINWILVKNGYSDKDNSNQYAFGNDGSNLYAFDNDRDVWKSNDDLIWEKVIEGYGGSTGTDGMEVDSSDNLYILLNTKIYKSSDSGVSWDVINDSISSYANTLVEIFIDEDDNFFILDAIGRVFKSIDSGVSWTEIGDCNNEVTNDPKGLTSFAEFSDLNVQVRSCNDAFCSGESWIDISDTSPQDLSVDNNRYFQYMVNFTSPDSSESPSLESVDINYDLVNTAPSVVLVYPQDGANYGYNENLDFNFSFSDADDNIDSCWYSLNGGANVSLVGCANVTIDVAEGSNSLIIYVNDSLGLSDSDSVNFNVVIGAPSIVLDYPIDVYFSSGENIDFNYTPSDIDLDSCWLLGDFDGEFKINESDGSPTSGEMNSFNLDLGDGTYLWNIGCNDSLGNSAINGNKTFVVDTVNPGLSVSEPIGGKTSRTIALEFSVSDNSPVSCLYNVYLGDSLHLSNRSVNCGESSSFDVSADGSFVLNFYVNDSAGHLNSTNSSFSVDTSSVPVVPPATGGSSGGSGGGGGIFVKKSNESEGFSIGVSGIGSIVSRAGEDETLLLDVKNIGDNFLNNCRLIVSGDISSWFYSDQVEGIAPGQNIDFVFSLNIPEGTEEKDYSGELELKCNEISDLQGVEVSVVGESESISIKEIVQKNDNLEVSYVFDNSDFIGVNIGVEVWVVDSDDNEIKRVKDVFPINKDGLIDRKVVVEMPEDLVGIYYVYLALSSDLEDSVKQSVVLGKSVSTGMVVFGDGGKMVGYVVFLLVVGGMVFFIIRRNRSESKNIKKSKKT